MKVLTLNEWLTEIHDNKNLQRLSTYVANEYRQRYPDFQLKKVYRKNQKGKWIAVGLGYDDRVLHILEELI